MAKKITIKEIKVDPLPLRALKTNYVTLILNKPDFKDVLLNKELHPSVGSMFFDDQKEYFIVDKTCYVHFKDINRSGLDEGQNKTSLDE